MSKRKRLAEALRITGEAPVELGAVVFPKPSILIGRSVEKHLYPVRLRREVADPERAAIT